MSKYVYFLKGELEHVIPASSVGFIFNQSNLVIVLTVMGESGNAKLIMNNEKEYADFKAGLMRFLGSKKSGVFYIEYNWN